MITYYIKKYGVHELHQADCVWLPIRKGMVELGKFDNDKEAVKKASTLYSEVSPCPSCCNVDKKHSTTTVNKQVN